MDYIGPTLDRTLLPPITRERCYPERREAEYHLVKFIS